MNALGWRFHGGVGERPNPTACKAVQPPVQIRAPPPQSRNPGFDASIAPLSHPTCEHGVVQTTWSAGPLIGFDLETTGTDRYHDVPVSFAFVPYEGGVKVDGRINQIVNPGRPIPQGAIDVHGISNERVEREGIALIDAAIEIVARLLEASEAGTPIVGSNLVYDLSMVEALARRELGVGLVAQGFNAPVIDVLVIDKTFAKYRGGKRRLEVLSEFYGVTLSGAHDAAADAEAAVQVAIAQAERFSTDAGRAKADRSVKNVDLSSLSLSELHERQIGWHRAWAEDFQQFLESKNLKPMTVDEFLWPIATPDDIPKGGSSSSRMPTSD